MKNKKYHIVGNPI